MHEENRFTELKDEAAHTEDKTYNTRGQERETYKHTQTHIDTQANIHNTHRRESGPSQQVRQKKRLQSTR